MENKIKNIKLKFYQTFGIPKQEYKGCDCDSWCPFPEHSCGNVCPYWTTYKVDYPEITDRILIQLICIYNVYCGYVFHSTDYDSLFCEILKTLTQEQEIRESDEHYSESLLKAIQQLFKENI